MNKRNQGKRDFFLLALTNLCISILCFFTFFRFPPNTFLYFFVLSVGCFALLGSGFYTFLFILAAKNVD
ncbi:hypothetical protein KTT_09640 [Tengunoibacter tsumagoiensis]|uniref:Uncharacterized protein n=1 Tax=Tengunoibacter tsumagoiensis TaxID=2014871 RepID=A0A401ZW24_9CHLR|nr:hypothetical protein KTT_09640 [Tengunoibacter tsumagoiensis]